MELSQVATATKTGRWTPVNEETVQKRVICRRIRQFERLEPPICARECSPECQVYGCAVFKIISVSSDVALGLFKGSVPVPLADKDPLAPIAGTVARSPIHSLQDFSTSWPAAQK